MTGRISCIVPHCRCTVAKEKIAPNDQWVCAKHYRRVPKVMRVAYRTEVRLAEKIIARKPLYSEYWKYPPGAPDRLAAVRMWRKLDQMWKALMDRAIEEAAGI